jgi:hypothetical protein
MTTIDIKKISGYFDQIEWRYKAVPEENLIITGYKHKIPYYNYSSILEVRIGTHWISFQAYLQRRVAKNQQVALLSYLSNLNSRVYQVRFFMVEDCVIVQTDMPKNQCHGGSFLEALSAICRYGTMFGKEIALIATSRSVAALYTDAQTLLLAPSNALTESGAGIPDLNFDITANQIKN